MKTTILLAVIIAISVQQPETSAKTANIIDIYRKQVFQYAVLMNRKPVVVYVSRSSCTLCSRLQRKMESEARANSESLYFARLDLDKLPQMREELGIESIPTMRAYDNGIMIGEVRGYKGTAMMEMIDMVKRLR